MKILSYSFLAAVAASGLALADTATTKPVGYVTETIKGGQFNLVGLTVQQPTVISGKVTAVAANSLSDSSVNFGESLTTGNLYILKVTSGTAAGVIQEISTWSGSTITTPDDLIAAGFAVGDSYQIRKAATLSDIFGPNNEVGLLGGGTLAAADVVWVPKAGGAFEKYFYKNSGLGGTGWRSSGGTASAGAALIYADAIFVERKAPADLNLVVSGEVETTRMKITVDSGLYNYVGGVYPVGATLANSGLSTQVLGGGTIASADELWFPDGNGGYIKCFYKNSGLGGTGWRTATGTSADSQPVTSGFIIYRRGGNAMLNNTPPAGYESL